MTNLTTATATEVYDSKITRDTAVVALKRKAISILTGDEAVKFYDHLDLVNSSPEVNGYVLVNGTEFDGSASIRELLRFVSTDNEQEITQGRYFGYRRDLIMMHFKHSMGRLLQALIAS